MNQKFDYNGAKEAGYSDEEIIEFVSSNKPNFDYEGALNSGYDIEEIINFTNQNQPEKSFIEKVKNVGSEYGEKAKRLGGQAALGAIEGEFFPIDLALSVGSSKPMVRGQYQEELRNDIERLENLKQAGLADEWELGLLEHLQNQRENPEEQEQFIPEGDFSFQSIAEKVTGENLHPEGIAEKSARWLGFIKDPEKIYSAIKEGVNPVELTKAVVPNFTELARSGLAGTALEMAEQNQFGPVGTIFSAVVGDLLGHGIGGLAKALTHPIETAAKATASISGAKQKKEIIQSLVDDFKSADIPLDAGTLTQSPLIQAMQARLAQSGLTGEALEKATKDLSKKVVESYENTLSDIGSLKFENNYQAAEAIKDALKTTETNLELPNLTRKGRSLVDRVTLQEVPEIEKNFLNDISPTEFKSDIVGGETIKKTAQEIKEPIKESFNKRWESFNEKIDFLPPDIHPELVKELEQFVEKNKGSLLFGESTAEAKVVTSAEKLLNKLAAANEALKPVTLRELMQTKTTLGDIANWEFAGSNFQSKYKKLYGEINEAIENTLQNTRPELAEEFSILNKEYSNYKDLFEHKDFKKVFEPKNKNVTEILNEFISHPDKLRNLEHIFSMTPEGQKVIDQVKRDYSQKLLSKNKVSDRDIRNLQEVLGPKFQKPIKTLEEQLNYQRAHPKPQALKGKPLGIEIPMTQEKGGSLKNRASLTGTQKAKDFKRKLLYDKISNKSPEQIMKQMDTVKGIKDLKKTLELTPEGKELFKDLARHKMAELIDSKMTDALKDNVKLRTFSNLLKSDKSKAIVGELIGNENLSKLLKLQRASGQLAVASEKFYNASKSGTTLLDAGLVGTAISGVLTGQPFLAVPAISKIGGSYVLAQLISNPKFLKELEKAILTKNKKTFFQSLQKMKDPIKAAIFETKSNNQSQSQLE